MTYGRIKNYALQLINRYSLAGGVLAPNYNDQQDYLNRIPMLVDDAVMYIATTVRAIPAYVKLSELESVFYDEYAAYTLPENCWRVKNAGLLIIDGGVIRRSDELRLLGDNKIIIPTEWKEGILEYYRYPNKIGDKPDDAIELDNSKDTHDAVPYYVAAHLMLDDNEFGYAALYNEFEARLERIRAVPRSETVSVHNEYSFDI